MTTTTITTPEGGTRPTSLGGVAVVLASVVLVQALLVVLNLL